MPLLAGQHASANPSTSSDPRSLYIIDSVLFELPYPLITPPFVSEVRGGSLWCVGVAEAG